MFAIAFDLKQHATRMAHPKSLTQAYVDIKVLLESFGFSRAQGSVYVTENEDMTNLFRAIQELKSVSWFPAGVGSIRVFTMEHGSDFTEFIKDEVEG